jgi:hypothetical protein
MTSPQSALKMTAKASWLFFSNLIVITVFGILFNWIAFIGLGGGIWRHGCQTGAVAPHASGPGAIIALVILALACYKPVGITLLFVVVFPFLYFLAGKSRGIKMALSFLVRGNQAWLFERIRPGLDKIVLLVRQQNVPEKGQKASQAMEALLSRPRDFLENAPGWLRLVTRFLLARTQASRWMQEIQGLRDKAASPESVSRQVEARLQEKVSSVIQVDSKNLLVLFLVNASALVLTYWFVR